MKLEIALHDPDLTPAERQAYAGGFRVALEIPDQTLCDVLDSAFAGGAFSYVVSGHVLNAGSDTENAWAGHVMSGGVLVLDITCDECALGEDPPVEKQRGSGEFRYTLTQDRVHRGAMRLMVDREYAHVWRDIMKEEGDAITGSVFLQFCLFGEVVF